MRQYKLVIAKPYLCVGAVLESIFQYEGYCHVSQEQIGEHYGLNIPPGINSNIVNSHVLLDQRKWGIVIPRAGFAELFTAFKLQLEDRYLPIMTLTDWEFMDGIKDALRDGWHVACGYSYGLLNNISDLSGEGHVSLLIDVVDTELTIMDPGPREPGLKKVSSALLYSAIIGAKDGLWFIRRR